MAIGKISGTMLQGVLERQGTSLSITSNSGVTGTTAYFDVANNRLGVNNNSPQYALDVTGNAHIGNLYIQGNTVTLDSGYKLNLGSIANVTIAGGSPNYILYTDGAGNLAFGNLNQISPLEVFTGNNITLGSNTVGALVSNAAAFTISTQITNSIATLNQVLGNITNSGGNIITVSGNITAGNIVGTLNGNLVGQVITPNQPYITTVGSLTTLTIIGNTTVSNISGSTATFSTVDAVTGLIIGANSAANTITTGSTGFVLNSNISAPVFVGNLSGNILGGTSATFAGNVQAGNLIASGTVTGAQVVTGNIYTDYIAPDQNTVTVFTGSLAVGVPTGTSGTRPSGALGLIRYNTQLQTLEFYGALGWTPVTNTITSQLLTPDGVSQSFTLNQTATTSGTIVSINGTVQQPTVAYNITGTTITFTEVPKSTDIVDVRFIASVVGSSFDFQIIDTGNITVGTGTSVIDSFYSNVYRSAKYAISSVNPFDAEYAEVVVLQFGGTPMTTQIVAVRTGGNSLAFSANATGNTVSVWANATTASNQLRIEKTYFLL